MTPPEICHSLIENYLNFMQNSEIFAMFNIKFENNLKFYY